MSQEDRIKELESNVHDLKNSLDWSNGEIETLKREIQKLRVYIDQVTS